ncbi:MAG: hypothetical protein MUP11_01095, partial [Anaerolineales bacterium]|nr:hypothetical protein [Anaerolineales bacterium]
MAKLDRGRSLQEVLACYPDLEEKLQPLLLAAMLSRALPQPVPSQTAIRLGKNQLLAKMDAIQAADGFMKPTQPQPLPKRLLDQWSRNLRQVLPGNSGYQPAYRLAVVAVIVLFAGGFFTLNASASSNPGDILYQLKMGLERARVVWSFNTNQKRTSEETAPELRSVTDSAEMINLEIKYNDYPGNKGISIWDIGSSSGKGDQGSSSSVSLGSVQG